MTTPPSNDSPTPAEGARETAETDAFVKEHAHLCEAIGGYVYPRIVEVARRLERERNEALRVGGATHDMWLKAHREKEIAEAQLALLKSAPTDPDQLAVRIWEFLQIDCGDPEENAEQMDCIANIIRKHSVSPAAPTGQERELLEQCAKELWQAHTDDWPLLIKVRAALAQRPAGPGDGENAFLQWMVDHKISIEHQNTTGFNWNITNPEGLDLGHDSLLHLIADARCAFAAAMSACNEGEKK